MILNFCMTFKGGFSHIEGIKLFKTKSVLSRVVSGVAFPVHETYSELKSHLLTTLGSLGIYLVKTEKLKQNKINNKTNT